MLCPSLTNYAYVVNSEEEYAIAVSESLHLTKWVHHILGKKYGVPESIYIFAAKKGDIDVFNWLYYTLGIPIDPGVTGVVAYYSHIHILNMLAALRVPFTEIVLQWAVFHDRYDMALLGLENGATWDSEVCNIAARKGNLRFLKFAIESGAPWIKTSVLSKAKRSGRYQEIADYIGGLRYA